MVGLFAEDRIAAREYARADACLRGGDWLGSFDLFCQMLRRRLGRRAPLTIGDRLLVDRIVDLAAPLRLTRAIDDLLAGLVAANKSAGYFFAADCVTVKRAFLAIQAGNHEAGLRGLEELEPRIGPLDASPMAADEFAGWEAACRWPDEGRGRHDLAMFFTRLYQTMGLWLAGQGCYSQAALVLQRGALLAQPPASVLASSAWLPLQLALAEVLVEQGFLAECEAALAAVSPHLKAGADPALFVQYLEIGADCQLVRGEFGAAIEKLAQVSELCLHRGFVRAALSALSRQADSLIAVNQLGLAMEVLAEARPLADTVGDANQQARIAWLVGLADLRGRSNIDEVSIAPSVKELWSGRVAEAPSDVGQPGPSPLSLPPAGNYMRFFEDRALALLWLLSRDDLPAARKQLQVMVETFSNAPSPRIHLRLGVLAGIVEYADGDYVEAARRLAEVCPALEQRGMLAELWQVLRFRGWCAGRLGAPPSEQDELARRAQSLLRRFADSLKPAQRACFLLNKWTAEEKFLAAEINELARLKLDMAGARWHARPLRRWRLWRRTHAFLDAVDENRRRLGARDASRGDQKAAASPSLLRWLWSHPRDTAIVSFLILPDRVFVACSRRCAVDFAVHPVTRVAIRERVAKWHSLARGWQHELPVPAEDLDERSALLADELQLPQLLASLPKHVSRLTIVPDDSLHGFPFAALRLGTEYLVEKYAIRVWYDRTRPPKAAREMLSEAITIAVSRGLESDEALPGAVPEAAHVSDWLSAQGAKVHPPLIDGDATRAAVLARLANADFAHFAGHGTFEVDRPERSGLLIVPRAEAPEILSLRDFAATNLSRLRHITLSSCWGADSFIAPGRWIISLPETLCRSGAGSVLSCLWGVDDADGREFVRRFYRYLANLPRDQALRCAQRDFLHATDVPDSLRNPCCWAGYILHGDSGALRFTHPR